MTTAAPDASCLKRLGCTIHVTNRNYKDKTDNQQQIAFMEISNGCFQGTVIVGLGKEISYKVGCSNCALYKYLTQGDCFTIFFLIISLVSKWTRATLRRKLCHPGPDRDWEVVSCTTCVMK